MKKKMMTVDVLVVGGAAQPSSGGAQPRLPGAVFTPSLVGD